MNIEQTKEAIAVMQAFVEGKTIQYWLGGGWQDTSCEGPKWSWNDVKYRIKPEVISYRRFLYKKADGRYAVETVTQTQKNTKPEGWVGFIRWIDTNWIEEVV